MHHEVMELAARVRAAHADAWAAEGVLREGGAALPLRDIRVMASGLPQPQWNGADVTGPNPDLDGARAFYAERGLSLGVRVPAEMPWSTGMHVVEPAPDGPRAGAPSCLRRPCPGSRSASPLPTISTPCSTSTPRRSAIPARRPARGSPRASARAASPSRSRRSAASRRPPPTACSPTGPLCCSRASRSPSTCAAAGSAPRSARGCSRAASRRAPRLAHLQADTDAAARVYARLGFADAGALEIFTEV